MPRGVLGSSGRVRGVVGITLGSPWERLGSSGSSGSLAESVSSEPLKRHVCQFCFGSSGRLHGALIGGYAEVTMRVLVGLRLVY